MSFWNGQRVLVTGGGGFIGSHLVEHLVANGAQVRTFVRYNSRGDIGLLSLLPPEIRSHIEVVAGDLRDLNAVKATLDEVDYLFHLGALIAIPYSYLHPAEVIETNILGTMNVLLAARDAGTQRIIHTSTSEVYGTALSVPIDESHPLQGQSPYSASKIGADKIVESFYCAYNTPVVTVRPFNTFGPRQSARAVIPTIITQALTNCTVHLGNLDSRRDMTYVLDTVKGFIKAAEAPGVVGETFNLGAGSEIRIGDLAKMIISLTGRPVKIVVDPTRMRPEKSEVQRLLSDNQLAKEKLGWAPQTSLTDGLKQTIDWVSGHLERYQIGDYQI
ncbi:MAG: SDR family NAD(P)-dependent oxidoreductase [Anaerolineales bacterium]|nr:SDR family NAD(P)-dependent oxidoreductase [Chloroflexota bacterium]MBL6982301.1 SDR family NAD(P)-dependent oxidoreductase [Anaerolineales bacterium]